MSALRTAWLAWGAVVALLAYPAQAQIIGQQSGILGGDEGFFRPTGGGAVLPVYDPDAQAYFNRVEGPTGDNEALEDGVKSAINDFVVGCKADGTWDAIKSSAILAGARTLAGALQPLVGTAPTSFNFVSGDYNRKTGLKGDGSTKYLNSNRNNNADPQNSKHLAIYQTSLATQTSLLVATTNLPGRSALITFIPEGIEARINSSTNTVENGNVVGFAGGVRTSSTETSARIGGTDFPDTVTSEPPSNENIGVFASVGGGAPTNARLSFYSIGESLDLALLDARVSALMTAIDGAITLTIDAMPYERTVTCDTYTVTGTFTGSAPTTWSASPSGDTGSCTDTGGGTFSCVVDVDPDASGEGIETITIGSETVDIGFYVAGSHSCFLAQSVDGSYNSTLADNDPVATWENLGTSALDVTQGTAANQPTLKTSIVGGQPVVRCDGGDRVVAATASDWDFMSDLSTFSVESVSNKPTDTNTYDFIVASGTGATGSFLGQDYRTATARQAFGHNGSRAEINSNQLGFFIGLSAVFEDTGGTDGTLTQNGSTSATFFGATSQPAPHALVICGSASTFPFTGDVFRALVYQSALDATQRAINQSVDEWALGGTLPVTP